MGDRNLGEIVQSLDLKSASIGFVISLLLAPLLSPLVTHTYVALGLPFHDEPELEFEATHVAPPYEEGSEVERYDNVTWQDSHGVYTFSVKNKGDTLAHNIKLFPRFPGCVQQTAIRSEVPVEVYNIADVEAVFGGQDRTSEIEWCSKVIKIDRIGPGESAKVHIVIDHSFERENKTIFADVSPSEEYRVRYQWKVDGNRYSEETFRDIHGAEDRYREFPERWGEVRDDYVNVTATPN